MLIACFDHTHDFIIVKKSAKLRRVIFAVSRGELDRSENRELDRTNHELDRVRSAEGSSGPLGPRIRKYVDPLNRSRFSWSPFVSRL